MINMSFLSPDDAASVTTRERTWHTLRASSAAILKPNIQFKFVYFKSNGHPTMKMKRTASTDRFLASFHLPYPEDASSIKVASERDNARTVRLQAGRLATTNERGTGAARDPFTTEAVCLYLVHGILKRLVLREQVPHATAVVQIMNTPPTSILLVFNPRRLLRCHLSLYCHFSLSASGHVRNPSFFLAGSCGEALPIACAVTEAVSNSVLR